MLRDIIPASQGNGLFKGYPEDGWMQLPNGLILQWGTCSIRYCGIQYTAFPVSFPNGTLSVNCTMRGNVGSWGSEWIYSINRITKDGFYLQSIDTCGLGSAYWMAIGY